MSSERLHPTGCPLRTAGALVLAALLTVPAVAQVPPGTAVVGTSVTTTSNGTSGLFLVPLTGGPVAPVPVTGLPAALTRPSGLGNGGVATMDLRRADGSIVVGMLTDGTPANPVPLDVYVLHLNGTAVVATQTIALGNATATGAAAWVAAMPDGRVLVGAANGPGPMTNGPLAGSMLAIVDPTGPTFTLIPNPTLAPAILGGLAVDPTGSCAYLPLTVTSPLAATLYRLDLATGATCAIANFPSQYTGGLSVDDDGTIFLSATDPYTATNCVHRVRPNGCGPATVTTVQTTMPPGGGAIIASGSALDRANQRFLLASGFAPVSTPPPGELYSVDQTGIATVIANTPPGGWGRISRQGIVAFNAIDSYGVRTDGLSQYWFDAFPNPGGQPVPGNLGFSLTVQSTPPLPVLSAVVLSFGRGSLAMAGVQVLVEVTTATSILLVPAAPLTCPMPIPANPSLSGLVIYAQSFHLETNSGLATSAGLAIRF